MKHLTLVRHAETAANAAGIWQGHGDAGLSELGRAQAKALGDRLAGTQFSRVVSSDLVRTLDTAREAGLESIAESAWREMDIGEWEGLTRDQVYARFPETMDALAGGADVPMGGGETWTAFGSRARSALDSLVADLGEGERVLVMTHGGIIHALISRVLGMNRRGRAWPIDRVANTALTEIAVDGERFELVSFNDSRHLAGLEPQAAGLIALIRHAESEANAGHRWDGRSDGPLSAAGRAQAVVLAGRLPRFEHVYTSPARRARDTAGPIAERSGTSAEVHPDLAEMDFGRWEGLTADEIAAADPEGWEGVFGRGLDLPRGAVGETFAATIDRGRTALEALVSRHPEDTVAVVSHGVLIRAIVAGVLGVDWPASRRIGTLPNAAVGHLRHGSAGPVLADYNA